MSLIHTIHFDFLTERLRYLNESGIISYHPIIAIYELKIGTFPFLCLLFLSILWY
jgi:hypothetical protein